jgi:hypothetical protein
MWHSMSLLLQQQHSLQARRYAYAFEISVETPSIRSTAAVTVAWPGSHLLAALLVIKVAQACLPPPADATCC